MKVIPTALVALLVVAMAGGGYAQPIPATRPAAAGKVVRRQMFKGLRKVGKGIVDFLEDGSMYSSSSSSLPSTKSYRESSSLPSFGSSRPPSKTSHEPSLPANWDPTFTHEWFPLQSPSRSPLPGEEKVVSRPLRQKYKKSVWEDPDYLRKSDNKRLKGRYRQLREEIAFMEFRWKQAGTPPKSVGEEYVRIRDQQKEIEAVLKARGAKIPPLTENEKKQRDEQWSNYEPSDF